MTSGGLPAVGVFDSGVGGLSIFAAVRDRLPGARYVYLCDNANFPYGVRTEEDVVACTWRAAGRLVERCGLDLLIIACNTASTVSLPYLRERLRIPVVGVVPAVKPAAQMSRTGTIGLLATPGTVKRSYTDDLIKTHAGQCRVLRAGSTPLVHLAEEKLRGGAVDREAVRRELAPLFDASPKEPGQRLDAVVLGCTHFPLLTDELADVAPWPVVWVDSSGAIAARTAALLAERGIDASRPPEGGAPPPVAYVTRDDAGIDALRPALARLGFARVEELPT